MAESFPSSPPDSMQRMPDRDVYELGLPLNPQSAESRLEAEMPTLVIKGTEYSGYKTNNPEVASQLFELFKEEKNYPILTMNMAQIDEVPAGHYVVRKRISTQDFYYQENIDMGRATVEAKNVLITDTRNGRVVNREAFTVRGVSEEVNAGTENLMSDLGYEVDDTGKIIGVPTPETIVKAAAKLGLQVELVPAGKLDAETYLKVFAKGKYPVSGGSENWYIHDIADDHITTLALGGSELMSVLQTAAQRGLESDDPDVLVATTMTIDAFTNSVGSLAYIRKGQLSYNYEQVIGLGERLDLKHDQTDDLIRLVRQRAEKYGIVLAPDPTLKQAA